MEQEQKLSDFNDAAAQMQRLHNTWLICDTYKEKGMISKYEIKLKCAESELKYDAKTILEKKEYLTDLKKINKEIDKCNKLILKLKDSTYLQGAINKKWSILIEKEELLREIQQESGKGGRYSDPFRDEGM